MAALTFSEQKLDELMGCECDMPVVCRDSYFLNETTMATRFACTGCGREIQIHSAIRDIYDVVMTLKSRKD